ncbi:MAG TPA: pentapeptide repeat-containing protein [Vicinamibacterales bacterium]|nr:pentapeptide repeat-containing protein [Vicinamibacterales bacterium]
MMIAADSPFIGRDSFEDEAFVDLDLSGADLANREFLRCTFTNVQLQDADLHDTRLDDCLFAGCDLSRMRAGNLAARGVVFVRCRLLGVDLTALRPTPSLFFEDCNLQYATFGAANLTGTAFRRCKLVEVNFFDTRLVDASFGESDLSGSRFEGCDVRGADFVGARGVYIDPARNTVRDARVDVETAIAIAAALGFKVNV